jgi:hypothetical protein
MQRGTIIKHRASWTLLYYDWQFLDGERKRVRVSKKLAFVSKDYPTDARAPGFTPHKAMIRSGLKMSRITELVPVVNSSAKQTQNSKGSGTSNCF